MTASTKPRTQKLTNKLLKLAHKLDELETQQHARTYAMMERNAVRREILGSRQAPLIYIVEKLVNGASYVSDEEKTGLLNFIHGLVPYFRMKRPQKQSGVVYRKTMDTFASVASSLAGSLDDRPYPATPRGTRKPRRARRATRRRRH
jgi:hypothetical protein